MSKSKLFTFFVIITLILSVILLSAYYKNESRQSDINTQFMSDYGNLIIGMLNRSIQTDETIIHKYDVENTKYGFRLTELYAHNTTIQNNKFNDIIMLLEQASGCDAWYDINMDKELYDKLNGLGQAVFSKPQTYTDEMLEKTWRALSDAVDFNLNSDSDKKRKDGIK